jgi:energy-coupling factor transport system permease protein
MKRFDEMNPAVVLFYYLCVITVAMFSMNPILLAISLSTSVLTYCLYHESRPREHLFSLLLFLVLTLINPLISHNGVTVLFYLNSRPFTLEATLYGVNASAMIAASLYRLRSMSRELTGEKVIYIFGRFSPKTALILSMSLRGVSLFKRRWREIADAQRALGLYRDNNLIDAVRRRMRVLSILITWALENGVVTAESMDARGYGSRRRTSYAIFRFTLADLLFILVTAALAALTIIGSTAAAFDFYPAITADLNAPLSIAGYIGYAFLCILPIIINTKEAIRWRCLRSAI